MTDDDVVEAMARGMWEASDAPAHVPDHWAGLAEVTRERMRQHVRAAIRACHAAGGLVVGKMPGEKAEPGHSAYAFGYARGHNAALAAVRAAAVSGEEV